MELLSIVEVWVWCLLLAACTRPIDVAVQHVVNHGAICHLLVVSSELSPCAGSIPVARTHRSFFFNDTVLEAFARGSTVSR